ncbi:MAG: ABC transporter permease [Devosia sp.]|jgi:peptide/nickel transport system permease protein|uniref:ABC transporter permease n=1 Tax=unclassified Devosia TaxID=196773 RepID=UPI0019F281D0|nr:MULTISPECIES: ABC transporter permease [unclassified Devosia]MBF0678645.1 ABC transporter permease [Devosia sp.]WEJ31784.1 ABC transporter permease [Devosia sp. SD17-2]
MTFIVRRLLQSLIVIIGVTLITFLALQMSGDPTYLYVSERATLEEIARTRQALGFDRPLHEQYLSFLGNLIQGDFGNSLSYKRPAIEAVMEALPATLELTIFAMVLAIFVAIPLGVAAALNRGSPVDGSIMTVAMAGQSIPSFWLGIMMIMFFGLQLRILPISGHVPFIMPLVQGNITQAFSQLPQALYYLIMPGFAVAFYSISRNARLVRSSMLEVLSQDFVRTARAKGISEYAVVVRHALRNAWLPVVTMVGLEFGFLIGGVVVVEMVFSWPGIGRLIFNAINQRDIPVVQAAVVVLAIVFISLNLIVDLVYAKIDPRVKL